MLSDLDLRNADLSGSNLTNADLRKTDLRGVNLWQTKLQGAQLQLSLYNGHTKWPEGFDYPHSGAVGPRAVLSGSDLHGIVFSDLDLREVDLSSANLANRYLHGVNFSLSNLHKTNFSNATLSSVDFSQANLAETDFSNAKLYSVRFESAILLPSTKLIGADYDQATSWPEQFDPVRAVMPDLVRGARILELIASILLIPLKLFALAVKEFPVFVFVSTVAFLIYSLVVSLIYSLSFDNLKLPLAIIIICFIAYIRVIIIDKNE